MMRVMNHIKYITVDMDVYYLSKADLLRLQPMIIKKKSLEIHNSSNINNGSFFYNNYSNNPNFTSRSDKIKILRIRMAARHCQYHCVNTSVSLTRLDKDVIGSSVFQFFFNLEWNRVDLAKCQQEKRQSYWCLSVFF
jgi:hypothetical protein